MNKEIIKSNSNTLRKAKNFPSATSIWSNSIYSFNQNYLKNIPAVDNIVNKLIKSFFSINALANNPKGKKSKLIQRRYKKLSLNKILVSKSEIKHNNDKVFITVYLFNKKKKSLLLKLRNLAQSLMGSPLTTKSLNTSAEINNTELLASHKNSNSDTSHTIGSVSPMINSRISGTVAPKYKTLSLGLASKLKLIKEVNNTGGTASSSNRNLFNNITLNKYVAVNGLSNIKTKSENNMESSLYAVSYLNNGVSNIMNNNKFFDKAAQSLGLGLEATNVKPENKGGMASVLNNKGLNLSNNKGSMASTVLYYKNLSLITRYNLHMFTSSLLGLASHQNVNKGAGAKPLAFTKANTSEVSSMKDAIIKAGSSKSNNVLFNANLKDLKAIDLKNLYKFINKYKLYNSVKSTLSNNTLEGNMSTSFVKESISKYDYLNGINVKPNYSIYKLKSMNKLFTLYNNINLGIGSSLYNDNASGKEKAYNTLSSNKMLLNTYKLLKKSYTVLSSNLAKANSQDLVNKASSLNIYNVAYMTRKELGGGPASSTKNANILKANFRKSPYVIKGLASSNGSYLDLKKSMRSIILINKLNRIDRFFDKYKEIFRGGPASPQNTKGNSLSMDNAALNRIVSNYKVNFISELMEKELLYVYYLKLLSYNDIVFKDWFLYPLKNLISKIYNKKVVFNLVNLKYIHLNSDILAQAVNIRLRNFKKNRVVKVLKKVIKLVPISKVNIYACDEHSSIYKYVNNYHNKFRNLKLDIFKELGVSSVENTSLTGPRINGTLRKLNHIQANTINFIKYKSVFGVRLEAAGRLTKRSTASRSIFKYRYNGTLRNNAIINNNISSVIIKDNRISNLQFTQISSKTRNGSFGLKGWINNN